MQKLQNMLLSESHIWGFSSFSVLYRIKLNIFWVVWFLRIWDDMFWLFDQTIILENLGGWIDNYSLDSAVLGMQITKLFPTSSCSTFIPERIICISTHSPSALPLPPVVLTASQSNSSLKKQRSRSIFSTFFCCFRNYNVDPPATNNSNTSSLPPPVEENGSPPKVGYPSTEHMPFVFSWWNLLLFLFSSTFYPSSCFFTCVCLSLLCCSVTRSRSSLSLVYVSPFFCSPFLCMQAEWAGAGTSGLCGLQFLLGELLLFHHAAAHFPAHGSTACVQGLECTYWF